MVKVLKVAGGNGTLVDDEDYEEYSSSCWFFSGPARNYVTRHRREEDRLVVEKLHRLIMNAPVGTLVDHVNSDPTDNRRCNLRLVTYAENSQNRAGVRNITPHKSGRFRVKMQVRRRHIHVGYFKTLEEAENAAKEARASLMPFSKEAFNRLASKSKV